MKISLNVIRLKRAFRICTDSFKISHGLTKNNLILILCLYFEFYKIRPAVYTTFINLLTKFGYYNNNNNIIKIPKLR